MIHYSCDYCKRQLDPQEDLHYVVKIEISQLIEPLDSDEAEDDRDYLQEIHDVLERLDDSADLLPDGAPREMRFDLCPQCARRFSKNPLGRDLAKKLNFSKN